MKNYLRPTDFVNLCEYLKGDCVEIVLEAEESYEKTPKCEQKTEGTLWKKPMLNITLPKWQTIDRPSTNGQFIQLES